MKEENANIDVDQLKKNYRKNQEDHRKVTRLYAYMMLAVFLFGMFIGYSYFLAKSKIVIRNTLEDIADHYQPLYNMNSTNIPNYTGRMFQEYNVSIDDYDGCE